MSTEKFTTYWSSWELTVIRWKKWVADTQPWGPPVLIKAVFEYTEWILHVVTFKKKWYPPDEKWVYCTSNWVIYKNHSKTSKTNAAGAFSMLPAEQCHVSCWIPNIRWFETSTHAFLIPVEMCFCSNSHKFLTLLFCGSKAEKSANHYCRQRAQEICKHCSNVFNLTTCVKFDDTHTFHFISKSFKEGKIQYILIN